MNYKYDPLESPGRPLIPIDYWKERFKSMNLVRLWLFIEEFSILKNMCNGSVLYDIIDHIAKDIYFKRILKKEE